MQKLNEITLPVQSSKSKISYSMIEDQMTWRKPNGKSIRYPFLSNAKVVCSFVQSLSELRQNFSDSISFLTGLQKTAHRALFQSADGKINMGLWFNDPDIDIYDICWFNTIAIAMEKSLQKNEGFISVDEELNTKSCYVELHRNGWLKCFLNS